MFIDYITLMLINMTAGLVILSWYLYKGLSDIHPAKYAPAFGIVGIIGMITGFHMTFTWPVPGSYNVAYGETTVLFSALFLGAAYCLHYGHEMKILGIYALFAGLIAVLIGLQIIILKMTQAPLLAGVGFILTGFGGIFALPTLFFEKIKVIRKAGALVMMIAASIWALTAFMAYYHHLINFKSYVPPSMKG